MTRIPLLSLLLGAVTLLLMASPPAIHELLYFDTRQLQQGMPLGIITAHWIHADGEHLAWNLGALLLIAPLIEMHSRTLLWSSLLAGTVCVDLLLISPWSDLQRYCGLSGVLNTLFGTLLYLYWRRTRSPVVVIVSFLAVVKIALEVISGQALFTDFGWPPFAIAHLAGILATPLAIWCACHLKSRQCRMATTAARSVHGDLVTGE
jgi:rhomboid family GlyGly-CTERM serine protease